MAPISPHLTTAFDVDSVGVTADETSLGELAEPAAPSFPSAAEIHAATTAKAARERFESLADRKQQSAEKFNFTLADLFLITTVTALCLSSVRWLGPGEAAGAMGVMLLLWWAGAKLCHPESRLAHLVWLALWIAYFLSCMMTLAPKR